MCGICGQINLDPARPVDPAVLGRMNAVIHHRGPDSDGFYLRANAGLAVRRLAIIDLATGDQPMCNEDGSAWIVALCTAFRQQPAPAGPTAQGGRG